MDILYYAVITFAWALGGFLSGVTSMGCSLVALPILNLVMSPDRAVLVTCVMGGVIPAVLIFIYHDGMIWRELLLLFAACIPGSMVGILLFEIISQAWLSILLACSLGSFVVWQTLGKNTTFRISNYARWAPPAGFFTGLFNSMTGMPGSILGPYSTVRTWTKKNLMSMQSAGFFISSTLTICAALYRDLYTVDMAHDICAALPGAAFGILVSIPVHKRLDIELCRKLLFAILGVCSLLLFYKGISSF